MIKAKISLENILTDNTSGSSEILLKLNSYFFSNSENRNKIRQAIKESKKKLHRFAVIDNYLEELEIKLSKNDPDKIKKFTLDFEERSQNKFRLVYNNAKRYLSNVNYFLTLSNSWTLLKIIETWKKDNQNLKAVVTESRPNNEGRIFAKKLLQSGIKVEFITDSLLAEFIMKVDAVITGADQLLANGNAVNKAGSRNAAIICKYYNKPFYVISSREKVVNKSLFKPDYYSSEEIWNYKAKGLKIKNIYFEEIDRKLITKIITD